MCHEFSMNFFFSLFSERHSRCYKSSSDSEESHQSHELEYSILCTAGVTQLPNSSVHQVHWQHEEKQFHRNENHSAWMVSLPVVTETAADLHWNQIVWVTNVTSKPISVVAWPYNVMDLSFENSLKSTSDTNFKKLTYFEIWKEELTSVSNVLAAAFCIFKGAI